MAPNWTEPFVEFYQTAAFVPPDKAAHDQRPIAHEPRERRPARWITSLRSAFQRLVRGQGEQLLFGLDAAQPVSTEGVELTGKAFGKARG